MKPFAIDKDGKKICPRCLKWLGAGAGEIHTCSPTPYAASLEGRIGELENALARVRCCEDACCPQCAEEIDKAIGK